VRFNLSHSGDVILLAFAVNRDLGVDVEQVRPEVNIDNLAASCFSPVERAAIFRNPDAARLRFFEYWAAKEAWMKADGRGMSLPLCDYTLTPVSSVSGESFTVTAHESGPLEWTVRLLNLRAGYTSAVASAPAVRDVRIMTVGTDSTERKMARPCA
jgi:4'-phosphopantetheinyl transferase